MPVEVVPGGYAKARVEWKNAGGADFAPQFRLDIKRDGFLATWSEGTVVTAPMVGAGASDIVDVSCPVPSNWGAMVIAAKLMVIGLRGVVWQQADAYIIRKEPTPPVFDWRDYDTDGDGVISIEEALRAVADVVSGIITEEQLYEVLAHREEEVPPPEPELEEVVFYGTIFEWDLITPVPGASVTWSSATSQTVKTDAQGYYIVRIRARSLGNSYVGNWFKVTISKSGYTTYKNTYWFEPYQWHAEIDFRIR